MTRYRFAGDTAKARRVSDKHLLWAINCAVEVTQLYRRVRAQYIAKLKNIDWANESAVERTPLYRRIKGQHIANPDVPPEIGLPDLRTSSTEQTLSVAGLGSLDEDHLRIDARDPSQIIRSKQGRGYRESPRPRPRFTRSPDKE